MRKDFKKEKEGAKKVRKETQAASCCTILARFAGRTLDDKNRRGKTAQTVQRGVLIKYAGSYSILL